MKNIKFRAWEDTEKKMYYIDLLSYMSHQEDVQDDEMPFNARINGLMQFTGLQDKNGKEIYEGDILRFENDHLIRYGEVKWNENLCRFYQEVTLKFKGTANHKKPTAKIFHNAMTKKYENMEIVGNIYENPEIIKEIK
jgi:uncharacterized phage protein (TIGR01671 family)